MTPDSTAAPVAVGWPRGDETPAWAQLKGHFEAHGRALDLREAFARDAGRFDALSFDAPHVFADLSKCLWDVPTQRWLTELAQADHARSSAAKRRA